MSWRINRETPANYCKVCGKRKTMVSKTLGVCVECIRHDPEASQPYIVSAHHQVRVRAGLPPAPPKTKDGIRCSLCANQCSIGKGEKGYCGLRWNDEGLKSIVDPDRGLLYYYLHPHVTNCCAAWFCPGGTGSGYPAYARRPGPETGYLNLSVYLYGCNFNCLYCQNASHKQLGEGDVLTAERLARQVEHNDDITCICYFGGSPEPQLPYTINASRLASEYARGRILRLCWEWNGCGEPSLVDQAAELALMSGGNLKFDLKCHTPSLSLALSGVDNERAYSNFELVASKHYHRRLGSPVLTASTLIVPGYVDAYEVERVAGVIAGLDRSIPYSLLVFHPDYAMRDLPVTPLRQMQECYLAASELLDNVKVGNLHTLGMRGMADFLGSLPR